MTPQLPSTFANEQSVIASVLDESGRSFAEASEIVKLSDFSTPEFAQAWTWMNELFAASRPLTIFALAQAYSQTPAWRGVQQAIAGAPAALGHVRHIAMVLADRAALRRTTAALLDAGEHAAGAETFTEIRPVLESLLMGVFADSSNRDTIHIREVVAAIRSRMANPEAAARGYRTGFPSLDAMTKGGPREKHLFVIAGKSGEGKTTLALNLLANMAADGIRCGFFSLEMDAQELTMRAICSLSRNAASFEDACGKVERMEIHISDMPDRTVESIRAATKLMVIRHRVQVIAVDYLQLIGALPGNKDSRERQVAGMSRALKIAAKESGVLVIALSQLNDDGLLRESRAIEQDSDEICYVVQSGDRHYLWLTKNRHGAKHGTVREMSEDVEEKGIPLFFDAENFRFEEKR